MVFLKQNFNINHNVNQVNRFLKISHIVSITLKLKNKYFRWYFSSKFQHQSQRQSSKQIFKNQSYYFNYIKTKKKHTFGGISIITSIMHTDL